MIIIFSSLGGVLVIGLVILLYCLCGKKKTEETEKKSQNLKKGETSNRSNTIHSNDVKIEIGSKHSENDQTKNNFVQLDQTSQIHSNFNNSVSLVGSDRKMLDNSSLIASSMRKDEENKGAERNDKKEDENKEENEEKEEKEDNDDSEENEENEENEEKEENDEKNISQDKKEITIEEEDKINEPNTQEQPKDIKESESIKETQKENVSIKEPPKENISIKEPPKESVPKNEPPKESVPINDQKSKKEQINELIQIKEVEIAKESEQHKEPELIRAVIPIKETKPQPVQEEKIDNGITSNEKQSIKQKDLVSLVKKRDIEKIEKNVNINDLDSQNSRIKNIFQRYNNHESESNNDEIEEDKSEESGQDNGHMSYEESKRPNQGEDNDEYLESNEYDNPELENEIKNQIGKYIMDQKEVKSIQSSVQENSEDMDSIGVNNKIEKDLTSQEHSEIFTEE